MVTSLIDPTLKETLLPKGVNDFLPEKAGKIGYIEGKIRTVFELWGFRRIITPLLEFHDVISLGMGEDLKSKAFRFDDRQTGKLLAITSDITPQIARIVATRMHAYPLPHRISYQGRVLRHAELQSGRSREIYQSGVELIGLDSPEADAEMVAMAVEVLQGLGIDEFKIDIGQVDFFRGIMAASGLTEPEKRLLREAIGKKDVSAVSAVLDKTNVSAAARDEIAMLPRLFGGRKVLDKAASVVTNDRSRRALDNIAQVLDILDIYGVSDYLTIDLGEIRGLDYHTGITFEGFVNGVGEAVCSGGRYDDLTARYGFAAPATGFAFNVLTLLSALDKRPEVEASKTRDFLLFNLKDDRREVLGIAQNLRRKGFSTARDIIRRDYANSLAYAQRMNILYMMVIGGHYCTDDEVYIVRVADNKSIKVNKACLLSDDFCLNIDP
ncbi:ATP phosphoribosyltransferase regulatory subunit [Geobacter sp. OR-1]|uniref:ATP phosphoribosyltransferase regulatory subunit n=1 Tax=Geobacter sp. OR-1 TaxID=1266765 RepID=UPI00054244BC|nr:ATP phosphoribosyltransferase regulatory subunit [Geobacter sp. OR-1]GAM11731.1 ATP phosphoribosyltransferase regulatory subunit [Geobacter sp. OR-1]